MLINGPWRLTDLKEIPSNGYWVFSCFHCGGGSTMGYKLAGMRVLGGVEIDPQMMNLYRLNHKPVHSYLMGVEEFNKIPNDELPWELFGLDILDGSPPCSSFSMAGKREKKWGVKSKFREGQTEQVLDDLFFHFINTARKLEPRVVIAENVKGLIAGKARGYVKEIFQGFNDIGYSCQLFLLNASRMGVPQKRERTFFIARRKGLHLPDLKLNFEEREVSVSEAFNGINNGNIKLLDGIGRDCWEASHQGDSFSKAHPKGSWFNHHRLHRDKPAATLIASGNLYHFDEPRKLSDIEYKRVQTFPDDYDLAGVKGDYVCGMSVPPFMMQRIAHQVKVQWLDRL